MSVADELNTLKTNLSAAYNAAEGKGATMPQDKNSVNLASTIESISGGGGSAPAYDIPEFDGGEYGAIAYLDNNGEVAYYTATSADDLNVNYDMSGAGTSKVVKTLDDGTVIYRSNLLAYAVGSADKKPEGNYFLASCSILQNIFGLEKANLSQIGNGFLYLNGVFNQPIVIPEGVTTIGESFLNGIYPFNSPVTLPQSLQTIEGQFMGNCYSFNQPLEIPKNVTTIGMNMLYNCPSFNSEITFPEGLTRLNGGFLYSARSFAQPLTLPSTLGAVSGQTLYACSNFTGPLTINTTTPPDSRDSSQVLSNQGACRATTVGVTLMGPGADAWKAALPDSEGYRKLIVKKEIPAYGLLEYNDGEAKSIGLTTAEEYNTLMGYSSTCTVGGQTIQRSNITGYTFGASCDNIGDYFLSRCTNLTKLEGLEDANVTELGGMFLQNCSSFNQDLALPKTLKTINYNFLDGASAFNGRIVLPEGLETIAYNFFNEKYDYNQPITLPSTLKSIGDRFMYNARKFNYPLTIPASLTAIGNYFLGQCYGFTQPLTIPSTVQTIKDNFMYECQNFTGPLTVESAPPAQNGSLTTSQSNSPIFATGVTLLGSRAQDWQSALPYSSSSYNYRKLILG